MDFSSLRVINDERFVESGRSRKPNEKILERIHPCVATHAWSRNAPTPGTSTRSKRGSYPVYTICDQSFRIGQLVALFVMRDGQSQPDTQMIKDRACPIALDVWKDPQGFVIAQHVRDEAWTYFRCWSEAGELADHIGCLHFAGVWHMECTRFSGWKSYPNTSETTLRSYYLQIKPSGLLDRLVAERSAKDPNWRRYDCRHYQHYVVESHDYFIELVAAQVTFTRLEGIQAKPWLDLWARI